MSRFGTLTLNGQKFDLDDLELGEMEEVENLCDGQPFGEMKFNSAKQMKAIAWILLRKSDPDLTFEAIGRLKLTEFVQGEADEEMPDIPPAQSAEDAPVESAQELSGVPV